MEPVAMVPPPLPPKTKRSPPTVISATVLSNAAMKSAIAAASDAGADLLDGRLDSEVNAASQNHVVKILICPQQENNKNNINNTSNNKINFNNFTKSLINNDNQLVNKSINNNNSTQSIDSNYSNSDGVICDVSPCIKISVNSEMIQNNGSLMTDNTLANNHFYYGPFNCGIMSSGQVSPSDTLDSGTCSDLDGTPPPLPKKKNGVSVTVINNNGNSANKGNSHKRAPSSSSGADSDAESSISCDSLNSGKISPVISKNEFNNKINICKSTALPQTLLRDIRNTKLCENNTNPINKCLVDEKSYEERKKEEGQSQSLINNKLQYETDIFYKFHINECDSEESPAPNSIKSVVEDETFAGYKDILGSNANSPIRSAKGTVRGVKNRVRAGIATFLQIHDSTIKSYLEKEEGKVVVYTTSMGVLRKTYEDCMKVKKILRTLLIKFDEKDVFMSREYQAEIKERMRCDQVLVPQVFVSGQHVGDAETIEILNESGELRKMLKPFKSQSVLTTCTVCGGFRLLPCSDCNGSKKSVHRNDFTSEFVALKCMKCDEVGLIKCKACC